MPIESRTNRIESLIREAASLSSSVICDKGDDKVVVLDHELVNHTPNLKLIGPVYPVLTHGDILPVLQGLDKIKPGYILLIQDTEGKSALLGDIIMLAAVKKNIAGLVCTGKVRDIAEASSLNMPVWSASLSPRAAGLGAPASEVGVAALAGVEIAAGDWLFGDRDGLVVVPAADARLVIKAAAIKEKKERIYKQRIENGEHLIEMMNVRNHIANGETIIVEF